MKWLVACRKCFNEFVLEGAWPMVPEHPASQAAPEAPCPGSARLGYPMYAQQPSIARPWHGW
ncbi:MAG: hypothetical protein V3V35_07055 [Dehalococcoidia bacterium]